MSQRDKGTRVVILGGGIVGAAASYFMSLQGTARITIVERWETACAASGKAGGFLGRSWGDGSPTEELHHQGFDLHEELAKTLEIQSFRKLPTVSVSGRKGGKRGAENAMQLGCSWLNGELSECTLMDPESAQVTPLEMTTAMMDAAVANGSELLTGVWAEGVDVRDGRVTGVRLNDGKMITADEIVVAMGPWSVIASEWFPDLLIPMEGIWSTSIILPPPDRTVEPFAVFSGEDDRFHTHLEIYPRPGSEGIYVCGLGGSRHLGPEEIKKVTPQEVVPDLKRVDAAEKCLRSMAPALGDCKSSERQACMRPCPADGLPLIGRLHLCGPENVTVATGTNCWGITWAPAIGRVVSEIVLEGKASSLSLDSFDPERFSLTAREGGKRGRHRGNDPVGEQW